MKRIPYHMAIAAARTEWAAAKEANAARWRLVTRRGLQFLAREGQIAVSSYQARRFA